jgi:hypothetical protein
MKVFFVQHLQKELRQPNSPNGLAVSGDARIQR